MTLRSTHVCLAVIAFVLFVSGAEAQSRPPESKPAISEALAGARTLLAANDLAGARTKLEAALAQNPTSAEAHYLLGMIAERQKDLSDSKGRGRSHVDVPSPSSQRRQPVRARTMIAVPTPPSATGRGCRRSRLSAPSLLPA